MLYQPVVGLLFHKISSTYLICRNNCCLFLIVQSNWIDVWTHKPPWNSTSPDPWFCHRILHNLQIPDEMHQTPMSLNTKKQNWNQTLNTEPQFCVYKNWLYSLTTSWPTTTSWFQETSSAWKTSYPRWSIPTRGPHEQTHIMIFCRNPFGNHWGCHHHHQTPKHTLPRHRTNKHACSTTTWPHPHL